MSETKIERCPVCGGRCDASEVARWVLMPENWRETIQKAHDVCENQLLWANGSGDLGLIDYYDPLVRDLRALLGKGGET